MGVEGHYRAMAAAHGMSVEMFDMLDITGGDITFEHIVGEEIPPGLLLSAEREGYLYLYRGVEYVWMLTPKGAAPFGGLTEEAQAELYEAGWRP